MPTQVKTEITTEKLGRVIADYIEGTTIRLRPGRVVAIEVIDADDPNNLKVMLDNGQLFTLRIFAGGS